jgi:hypothetical protein
MANNTRALDPESKRLADDERRAKNWKRWGPYLSERQWGTVREDYSADGDPWNYVPHDHARSRAYRWGEDGILGICDREARLCFAIALWNGRDPILKERLFGLSGPEGNHGEDVKEAYFYLDSSPTHSYMRGLYKYPQAEFPYARLVEENRRRSKLEGEFELADTGVFDESRYFDVEVEYAKAAPDDVLIRVTCTNRGPEPATLHLLPTLWFRNVWSWGCDQEGCQVRPILQRADDRLVYANEPTLGRFLWSIDPPRGVHCDLLFTENETNTQRVFGSPNISPFVKDAFDAHLVHGDETAVNPKGRGTKCAAHMRFELAPGASRTLRMRLVHEHDATKSPFGAGFERTFEQRKREHEQHLEHRLPAALEPHERAMVRQAYAGLLWSRQFYHYAVDAWLAGDPGQPRPPEERKQGRNRDWRTLYNRDVISMPDKWEYPWYAAWDLAFHMIPMARIDPAFAKQQLVLFLREWYMHPNGQIPAYEFAFSDVNPPVHAWACWRVYKMTGVRGERDRAFLVRCFHKLLLNFTWWVNRKDPDGKHVFSGGFLGLDNIGIFDRSKPLPFGATLEQADGTAWMASYCLTMLAMALELARNDAAYEDVASKFFEHFVAIADAMNALGGNGLWDEEDGFYYDQVRIQGEMKPLRVRSMVGIIPLFSTAVLEQELIDQFPGFKKRMQWFLDHRKDLAQGISYMERGDHPGLRMLAIPSRERLRRALTRVLDESEFLSPFGVRSLSRAHAEKPYVLHVDSIERRVDYEPGESTTSMFGGNSNWRGPIWFPVNYLLIEGLKRYHHFYRDSFTIECPTGSGRFMNLHQVADELNARLVRLFLPDAQGRRPCHGADPRFATDPHWKHLVLFHEYFHGDDGRGLGASHQTGWTALAARCAEEVARARARAGTRAGSAAARNDKTNAARNDKASAGRNGKPKIAKRGGSSTSRRLRVKAVAVKRADGTALAPLVKPKKPHGPKRKPGRKARAVSR